MDNYLQRLEKRLVGDGPAERQVLLMKLVHEFDNAPEFGNSYIADANSPQQRWIARIGALLCRAGLTYELEFKSTRSSCIQFWTHSRESFRRQLIACAEEIRLELELNGEEEIGRIYDAQRQYDFLRDLKNILLGAQQEVFVIDPYFDGAAFETYLHPLGAACSIRVLCGKHANEVVGHVKAFEAQYGKKPDIRKSRDLHDRIVIIDSADCWVVGGSIKDAGKRPTYLVPLQPSIAPGKISIYEGIWQSAFPI